MEGLDEKSIEELDTIFREEFQDTLRFVLAMSQSLDATIGGIPEGASKEALGGLFSAREKSLLAMKTLRDLYVVLGLDQDSDEEIH